MSIDMVYPIYDSTTEVLIQRTIDGIQRMITIHHPSSQGDEGDGTPMSKEPTIEISLASKRHWELEIKTLQDVPRDADRSRQILKDKQEEYEKAEDSEHIERLVPEIEMLKFVLFLVCRNLKNDNNNS
jgi:hypothetical protein